MITHRCLALLVVAMVWLLRACSVAQPKPASLHTLHTSAKVIRSDLEGQAALSPRAQVCLKAYDSQVKRADRARSKKNDGGNAADRARRALEILELATLLLRVDIARNAQARLEQDNASLAQELATIEARAVRRQGLARASKEKAP